MIKHRTIKGGVMTTKGFVNHLKHPDYGFDMPVKVTSAPNSITGNPRPPCLRHGILVFALPCGFEYLSTIKVESLNL